MSMSDLMIVALVAFISMMLAFNVWTAVAV